MKRKPRNVVTVSPKSPAGQVWPQNVQGKPKPPPKPKKPKKP